MMTRRGTSLIEMMVVVVLLGSVGSLTIQILLIIFHTNAQQQEEAAADFALDELETSLRDDVHAAQQAEVDGSRLALAMPGGERVVYSVSAESVSRERLRSSGDQQQVVQRERFSLPRGLNLLWRKESADNVDWLFVELHPHDPQSPEGRKKTRLLRDANLQIRIGRGQGAKEETP